MNVKDLLKDMKESVGTKDPLVFFGKMVDVFTLLLDKVDSLECAVRRLERNTVLLTQWDSAIAYQLIAEEISFLRLSGKQTDGTNMYDAEIESLKHNLFQDKYVSNYSVFVKYWKDVLGYHPFLEGRK